MAMSSEKPVSRVVGGMEPVIAVEPGLKAASDPFSPAYVFPRCPHCASYALYRKNNIGSFACMTCGARDISETAARGQQEKS